MHSVLLLVILIIVVRAKLKRLYKDRTVLIGDNAFIGNTKKKKTLFL